MTEPAYVIASEPCPLCRSRGEDSSGDNLKVYSNGGKFCFACNKAVEKSDDYKKLQKKIYSELDFPVTQYDREDWERDKVNYTTDPAGYRSLKKATCDVYGVRHEFDTIDGKRQVIKQYYPISKDEVFSGVKIRIAHPEKDFSSRGYNRADCELFGQAVFRSSSSRWIVIASGELDALSAFQMLNCEEGILKRDPTTGDYTFPVIPVVSGTAGEASSLKQYKNNYEFLNRFETIFIIPDKDEKGEEALHKVAQSLPKDKLKVIDLPAKDANALLESGRQKDFVQSFWKAKYYSPAGIIGSDQLYEKMLEKAQTKKIEFPPEFLEELNEVTGGGMTLGSIVNITGGSGSGKSTVANEIVKYHILKKDYGVGVISLESDAGDYAENVLSAYIKEKLHWIKDPEEKVAYLRSDAVKQAARELFYKEDGTPSFHMIDERGDYGGLQAKIEELIISCDVQIILIDVLSDVFDGESMEFQSKWMSWEKATVKRYPVTFINVVHTRKPGGGQKSASTGGVMTEEDISGSSTQYKSASLNLIISRNKVAEDEMLRNVMTINLFKNRQTGWTGEVSQLYYDSKKHSFTELKSWFNEDPSRAMQLGLDPNDPVRDLKEKDNPNKEYKEYKKSDRNDQKDKPLNSFG